MLRRRWFPWRLWTWWNARLDRRRNLPAPEATALSETERQVQTGVNITIRDAEQRFAARADPLESKRAEIEKALREIYEPEYERLRNKTGRLDVQIYLSRPAHYALMALFTIGEAAFNVVAFNVFQEPAIYTVLMTSAVAVAIPVCAYLVGIWLRQWPPPWWATAAKLVGVVGIVAGVLIAINRVRLAYLGELAPEFARAHPELDLAFFAINILVLVGAAAVTYLAYDPEPQFAEAKAKVDWGNAAMREIEGKLDQLANAFRTEVEMAREAGWQLMAYYRMVNRRRRERVPRYFDDETEKNYRPEFATVNVGQYHVGPLGAVATPWPGGAPDHPSGDPRSP